MVINPHPTVAILGCGRRSGAKEGWAIGHAHADGWLKANPQVLLHGVDISPDNLAAFGERLGVPSKRLFTSTEALYAAVRPDFVSVCTWPALHCPMVLEAVKQGAKGIVCEKPMAMDPGQMQQMRKACAKAGTRLAIAHQRRYEPPFQLARKLLHEGAIGDQWVFEGRVGDDWDILSWTVHWFDMANFLFGARPLRVMAGGDVAGQRRYQQAIENASVIFAEYEGARQALFVTGPAGDGITVRGTKGMMQIDSGVKVWNESGFTVHTPEKTGLQGGFVRLMQDMLAATAENRATLCDVEECYTATEMAYAAHESMRTGQAVALPFGAEYAPLEVMAHPSRPAFGFKKIVLLADEHFGSGGREGLAEALGALAGEAPTLVEAAKGLDRAALEGADLLVLYHTQKSADEPTRQAMARWIEAAKPLLLVHAALGAYPDWPEYARWCGRVWDWDKSEHPHEVSALSVTDEALATGWKEAWLPRDEVFIKLGQRGEVIDLMAVQISAGIFPGAWISRAHPNIGVWVPGHRRDIWTLPAMRQGVAALGRMIAKAPKG